MTYSEQPEPGLPHSPQPSDPQPYNPPPYNPQPYSAQPYNPQPYSPQPYNPQPYNPPGPMPPQPYAAGPAYGYLPPQILVSPARPSSGAAVWALVLGIVGVAFGWCLLGIPCLLAVIIGHVAIADTRDDAKSGRGQAVAGLTLGYVALAPAIILFFWLVMGGLLSAGASTTSP